MNLLLVTKLSIGNAYQPSSAWQVNEAEFRVQTLPSKAW